MKSHTKYKLRNSLQKHEGNAYKQHITFYVHFVSLPRILYKQQLSCGIGLLNSRRLLVNILQHQTSLRAHGIITEIGSYLDEVVRRDRTLVFYCMMLRNYGISRSVWRLGDCSRRNAGRQS